MMRVRYCAQFAIAACLLLATGCTTHIAGNRGGGSPRAIAAPAAVPTSSSNIAEAGIDSSVTAEAVTETAVKQADAAAPRYFVDGSGLAIRGTDPVAYFTEGAPVAGSPSFTHRWGDATWQFASAENRDLFAANPAQYAPQYGGFCAWAVSQGYTASIDPNAWRIVDGKLYLNYSRGVQRQWERDIAGNISKADANWPGMLGEF